MVIIFGGVFALIGIIVIFLGIKKQKVCTEVTVGKVIDISREVSHSNIDNPTTNEFQVGNFSISSRQTKQVDLYPIYEYEVDENKYIKKSNTTVNGAFVGQTVNIIYNPDNPSEFYVGKGGMKSQIILGIAFVIMGIIVIVTSL